MAASTCSSSGRPPSSASCLACPMRDALPAASTTPRTRSDTADLSLGPEDPAEPTRSPSRDPGKVPDDCPAGRATAAVAGGDHLGQDRNGRLLRRLRADVQADRPGDAGDVVVAEAGDAQPLQPLAVGAAAAHRPDVGDRALQQGLEGGVVEAW